MGGRPLSTTVSALPSWRRSWELHAGPTPVDVEWHYNVLDMFLPLRDIWRAMQLPLLLDERHRVLEEIDRRLRLRFGLPGPWLRLDPTSQLVLGMVGGRTYEAVTLRAFEALIWRFRSWDRVRDAPVAALRGTIAPVTFAEVKAGRLKAALRAITALRGCLLLDFLGTWPVDEALAWLERLPGVGRKTAAATLNFSTLRMQALVIDTHHLRVLRRLGLVGWRSDALDAYGRIVPYLPASWAAEDLDTHHQLMKALGQRICRHAKPICRDCPLQDLCRTAGAQSSRPGPEPDHSVL